MKKEKNNSEINILLTQLSKLQDKEKRIKEAYINGIDTIEEYKENKSNLSIQKSLLDTQLNKLKNKDLLKEENKFQQELRSVYELLIDNTINMNKKYELSHLLINSIVIARDEGILELTYNA